jgi:hypothetical protein
MSSEPKDAGTAKGDARSDRLTVMRKNNEEVLRKKMKNDAMDACKERFVEFGKCAEREGIMVAFKCRPENEAMGACMAEHYTEELFQKYAASRGFSIAAKPTLFESLRKTLGV